jgi:hypothetical protein
MQTRIKGGAAAPGAGKKTKRTKKPQDRKKKRNEGK